MLIGDRCEVKRGDAWKPGMVIDFNDDREKGFAYIVTLDDGSHNVVVKPHNVRCERVVRVLCADGTERVLEKFPTYDEMREIVGGYVELANVMDRLTVHDPEPRPVMTRMVVNEEGLIYRLPRNEKATEIYQRNVRHQFKGHPDPFTAADEAFKKLAESRGARIIGDITPRRALEAGHKKDPWIAGDAIYFQGYTSEEVERIMNEMSEEKDAVS